MSRHGRRIKGIYERVKTKQEEIKALPILVHGDKAATVLLGTTERVANPRTSRVALTIDALKKTAAVSGSFSLSANQIGITNSVFVIHKEILEGGGKTWLHPHAYTVQEQTPFYED